MKLGGCSVDKIRLGAIALVVLLCVGVLGAIYGQRLYDLIRFGEGSSVVQERSLETISTLPVSEMYAQAQDKIAAQQLDIALVILEGAAQRGHARSATAIGEMYDPSLWGDVPSPFTQPSAELARDWYAQAADKGEAPAQNRLEALSLWEESQ